MKIPALLALISMLSPVLAQTSTTPTAPSTQEDSTTSALKTYAIKSTIIIFETQAKAMEEGRTLDDMLEFQTLHLVLSTVSTSELPSSFQAYFKEALAIASATNAELSTASSPEQREHLLSECETQMYQLDNKYKKECALMGAIMRNQIEPLFTREMESLMAKNMDKIKAATTKDQGMKIQAQVMREGIQNIKSRTLESK